MFIISNMKKKYKKDEESFKKQYFYSLVVQKLFM